MTKIKYQDSKKLVDRVLKGNCPICDDPILETEPLKGVYLEGVTVPVCDHHPVPDSEVFAIGL